MWLSASAGSELKSCARHFGARVHDICNAPIDSSDPVIDVKRTAHVAIGQPYVQRRTGGEVGVIRGM